MPIEDLAAVEGVDLVAPIAYAVADFVSGADDPVTWPVSGFEEELLAGRPPALDDIGRYGSEQAAWRAVLDDPGLVIVDEFFLVTDAGPPTDTIDVGDNLTISDPLSGEHRRVTVAALAPSDWLGNGAFYGMPGLTDLMGDRLVSSRALVSTPEPDAVAERLRTGFVANGVEADTIRERVETMLSLNNAFFTLMEQFVAVEGVVIGMSTALVASYGLTTSSASWAEDLEWSAPVGELALFAVVTVPASLLASLWPARAAARTRPAVALRLAD